MEEGWTVVNAPLSRRMIVVDDSWRASVEYYQVQYIIIIIYNNCSKTKFLCFCFVV